MGYTVPITYNYFMSKRQLSALLGFWVIIFLSLGFPIGWDKWVIAPVTGILIILVAYRKTPQAKPLSNSAFVQSNNQSNPPVTPAQ